MTLRERNRFACVYIARSPRLRRVGGAEVGLRSVVVVDCCHQWLGQVSAAAHFTLAYNLMRRVLPGADFAGWLSRFLPSLAEGAPPQLLTPAVVSDRSDGQIVHLDGLNLSRAWSMWGIAAALPRDDRRRSILLAAADQHAHAGLIGLGSDEYMGEHWLGSFALYMLGYAGSS
jgi:hypothetical protein